MATGDAVCTAGEEGTQEGRAAGRALARAAPWALLLAGIWAWYVPAPPVPRGEWRAAVLVVAAITAWALEVLPDFVVALGLALLYDVLGLGPSTVALSGFATPTWFLLVGILVLAAALGRSGLLHRLAGRLLRVFPPTFGGQAAGLLLGGMLITPLLPLTVGRCALAGPLAARLSDALGYVPRSRQAVGLGLAAYVGAGMLCRGFLTGATLNLLAWGLLPRTARVSWGLWAFAAGPVTLTILSGSFALILTFFRPSLDRPLDAAALAALAPRQGKISPAEHFTGAVIFLVLAGLVLAPYLGIEGGWIACGGAMALLGGGVLSRQEFRTALDWPLLLFLGVILSVPAMLRHAGLEARLAALLSWALHRTRTGSTGAVFLLFLLTVGARFVLSEWTGVPVLTMAFVPAAADMGIHPWVVAFVVLLGSTLWLFPYQFTSYLAFWGGSEGRLFEHAQVRPFALAHLGLCLLGLAISLPLWRLMGLLR